MLLIFNDFNSIQTSFTLFIPINFGLNCRCIEQQIKCIFCLFEPRCNNRNLPNNKCSQKKCVNIANIFLDQSLYYIALYYKKPGQTTEKNLCGGTIISTNVILTAAHCVKDIGEYNVTKV